MRYLSSWTTTEVIVAPKLGTKETVTVPLLFVAYPDVQAVAFDNFGQSSPTRMVFDIQDQATIVSIGSDFRFITVPDSYTLEDYRQGMLTCLEQWLEQATVTVGGVTLPISNTSQARLTSLYTLHTGAIAAGAEQATDSTWIYDASGIQHTMTIAQALALLIGYGQAVQVMMGKYYGWQAAIGAAKAAVDLDIVVIS